MNAKITKETAKGIIIEIQVDYEESMLKGEEGLQEVLNEAGSLATGKLLAQFDTDGSPLMTGDIKWTSKGKINKVYETPYGKTQIKRHIYQTSKGGRGRCPLEENAKIIKTATPKFAKIISSKYAEMGAKRVQIDLASNHGRSVQKRYVQDISEIIGTIVEAKEEKWEYELPEIKAPITTIASSLDGTCMLMQGEGWREAMTGAISLYDAEGKRQHTVYTAASPEYGKKKFLNHLESEIKRIQKKFPEAENIGVADGAKENWKFLERLTKKQILDFFHATEYVGNVGIAIFKDLDKRKKWIAETCHKLKNKEGTAKEIYEEILSFKNESLSIGSREKLEAGISYFRNNLERMNYAKFLNDKFPIGSGVIEAACKVIVKQRLCQAGMRWKDSGASIVLSLRALSHTPGRWEQFWQKIDRFGVSLA